MGKLQFSPSKSPFRSKLSTCESLVCQFAILGRYLKRHSVKGNGLETNWDEHYFGILEWNCSISRNSHIGRRVTWDCNRNCFRSFLCTWNRIIDKPKDIFRYTSDLSVIRSCQIHLSPYSLHYPNLITSLIPNVSLRNPSHPCLLKVNAQRILVNLLKWDEMKSPLFDIFYLQWSGIKIECAKRWKD